MMPIKGGDIGGEGKTELPHLYINMLLLLVYMCI